MIIGPNNRVWVTLPGINVLGEIDGDTGTCDLHSLADPLGAPVDLFGMAAGPDGNLIPTRSFVVVTSKLVEDGYVEHDVRTAYPVSDQW